MPSILAVVRRAIKRRAYRFAVEHLWRASGGKKHALPGSLLVSLTSYRPRFDMLHLTLRCLLDQTVRADAVILWIAETEVSALPEKVRALQQHGLVVKRTADLKSYKKLVPLLREQPGSFVATADDDTFYPRNWLEGLAASARADLTCIHCYRARTIQMRGNTILPYREWPLSERNARGEMIVPIGVGGVLYPPHALDERATDVQLFTRLCPAADDLWFYWMARQKGTNVAVTAASDGHFSWPDIGGGSLGTDNIAGGRNDSQLAALRAALPL